MYLADYSYVDGGVIATARELFECRHYPSVVAVITDALESEPECVELLVIRARAHIKLRRDLDAQTDLRDIIRIAPSCGVAYRLLGELAARRDENESAAIFFREALRLDADDHEAAEWLQIVETSVRPAAVAKKLPAPAAAAGRFPITRAPVERGNTATGANPRSLLSPARGMAPGAQPRFARGTSTPVRVDDVQMQMARGSARKADVLWTTPAPELVRDRTEDLGDIDPALVVDPEGKTQPAPYLVQPAAPRFDDRGSIPALPPPPNLMDSYPVYDPSLHKRRGATEPPPARTAPGPQTRMSSDVSSTRGPLPELPGFADYLVDTGILTRERLRAAQAYQRSMKVQLSTAIVTLGLATQQRIEWASVAHQSQLARDRRAHG